jgi:hypothetical protein
MVNYDDLPTTIIITLRAYECVLRCWDELLMKSRDKNIP